MEKAKYGKMRQVNAVNGSQMVVKIGGSYYRRSASNQREYRDTRQQFCCFEKLRRTVRQLNTVQLYRP